MIPRAQAVLVTGCSSGLGRFTAHWLKRQGWRVIATARREADVTILASEGLESILLDLNSSSSIQNAAERCLTMTEGVLHGVVNNAGVEILGALEDMTRDDLRGCFETNVFGTLELTNHFIPAFRRQGSGRIVFVSSSNSNGFAYPYMGPGNASKTSLEVFATTLKRELKDTGVGVCTVCPGEISTNLLRNMLRSSEHLTSLKKSVHATTYALLKKRLMQPDEAKPEKSLLPVARAIEKALARTKPPRRTVVPFSAKLHYFAHGVLPDGVQDILLFRKMRKLFGSHV